MKTLFLDQDTQDLMVDAAGNIATATGDYAIAQDAASYIKVNITDAIFDQDRGIPYKNLFDNKAPPTLIKQYIIDEVTKIPEVLSAEVFFVALENRVLYIQIQIKSTSNQDIVFNVGLQ